VRFKIVVNEWNNFYFFLQNLSKWHFSNRKEYNLFWEREIGPFNINEKKALKKFREIHLRYPFGKSYLGLDFFLSKNPFKTLKKRISNEEVNQLKGIFSLWKSKFKILYEKELPLLLKWKKELQKKINDRFLVNKMNAALSSLYKSPILRHNITIHLLLSAPNFTQGMNITEKNVGLSISRYPLSNLYHAVGIIWHELIHSHFEKYYFLDLLAKKFQKEKKKIYCVREIAASSLLPNGVLGKEFLNQTQERLSILTLPISKRDSQLLLKIAKEYFRKKKPWDEKYLKRVNFLIPKLEKIFV